jgi:co-chaperonin GroES (HSP10)
MSVRLLRGRVVIREDHKADFRHFPHIIVPDPLTTHNKDAVAEGRTWHRGTVLAMGEPALTPTGAEVDPGFQVGDSVVFHFSHNEKQWTRPWTDGELAVWCPQWCVDAVLS